MVNVHTELRSSISTVQTFKFKDQNWPLHIVGSSTFPSYWIIKAETNFRECRQESDQSQNRILRIFLSPFYSVIFPTNDQKSNILYFHQSRNFHGCVCGCHAPINVDSSSFCSYSIGNEEVSFWNLLLQNWYFVEQS